MATRTRKSSNTLDAAQGNEQKLRAQLASADKLNGELLAKLEAVSDHAIAMEDRAKSKERKLVSAFGFVRKYRKMLEDAGLLVRESSPVDDVLAARRAAMAAAKAEAMATGTTVAAK